MAWLAKGLYSLVLLGLAGVLLRELWTVWFDTRIFIGKFEVVSESGKDETAGPTFAKRIAGAHSILAQQLTDYQTKRTADSPSDATYVIPGMSPLALPQAALGGAEVTVQNVNIGQLLTALRKGFASPSEISGSMTVREGSVLGAVEWPAAPSIPNTSMQRFLVPAQASEHAAAAYIASSVSWARAAGERAGLELYPRAQFSDFAVALGDLYALSQKASTPTGIGSTEAAVVRARASQLRTHYGSSQVYPELYRLRADLLDLLPESDRKVPDLVELQEDRLRYAMLSPRLRDLSPEDKRFAALALARPAIVLDQEGKMASPENWTSILDRRSGDIAAVANAVGIVIGLDGQPVGTGTLVAPGVMLTGGFVINAARSAAGKSVSGTTANKGATLCMGTVASACGSRFGLGKTLVGDAGTGAVLVEVVEHDAIQYRHASIAEALPPANTVIGQYLFVVGYPFDDQRMPAAFMKFLLGGKSGVKRLMPGRALALDPTRPSTGQIESVERPLTITSDISTSSGTGGGPLVELTSGKIIGISYGGSWKGERGKFAFGETLSKPITDHIASALSGERVRSDPKPAPGR